MRWFVVVAAAVACLLWLAKPQPLMAGNERVITIYHDGAEQTVVTDAPTVGEALDRAGVKLSKLDGVEPELNTQLVAPSYNINIYRARPVTVVDGALRREIVSSHTSARQIATDAGIKLYDEDTYDLDRIDDFVSEDGIGLKLTVHRSKPVLLMLYGQEIKLRTMANSVEEFVAEKQLNLAPGDELWPKAGTKLQAGMTIALFAKGTMDIEVLPVPFAVKKIQDADRPVGYRRVVTPGVRGKRYVIAQLSGGHRRVIHSFVLLAPKEQVEIVGTKGPTFEGDFAAALQALRNCEARSNGYATNTGNGFYGAYQFTPSTWSAHAPIGWKDMLPVAPAVPGSIQDAAAQHLYNARGWQPWPTCSVKIGLQDIYR